jgi:hypothetical protein
MDRIETLTVRLKVIEMDDLAKVAVRLGLSKSDVTRRALAFSLPIFSATKLPGVKDESRETNPVR